MRLFLLPISTRRSLLYCQRLNHHLNSQKTIIDKVTEKASKTWHQWENSEKKYQKSITEYGNKVFQRISFEEWGLKTIPPLSARRKQDELMGADKVEVIFPSRYIAQERLGDILGKLALSGSKHIEFILENKLLKPAPSPELDNLYPSDPPSDKAKEAKYTGDRAGDNVDALYDKEEVMLLRKHSGEAISNSLDIPELRGELERAIHQVEASLKAQKELKEEKRHMDGATNSDPGKPGNETDEKR
ncbi:MAG: hypothetical protein M1819_005289 [Sarea resinae]|nr:MAG: hypothetical protein M1819_005289 [Sarea resinae]